MGGRWGGGGFYLIKGKPVFDYNADPRPVPLGGNGSVTREAHDTAITNMSRRQPPSGPQSVLGGGGSACCNRTTGFAFEQITKPHSTPRPPHSGNHPVAALLGRNLGTITVRFPECSVRAGIDARVLFQN